MAYEVETDGPATGAPLVVLLHGGFWRAAYDLSLMRPLAAALATDGYAVWNVEYRRVGMPGGGWPGTLDDVGAAIDAAVAPGAPVVLVGHSAGGHLALWAAAGRPVAGVVSLAGVADLGAGARDRLGAGAVQELLGGGPQEVPERYAAASPRALLPLGPRILLVHGDADDAVPVSQSRDFAAAAAAAGDRVELVDLPGVDHMSLIDPAGPGWAAVRSRLAGLAGG